MVLDQLIATVDNGGDGLSLRKLDEGFDYFESREGLAIGASYAVTDIMQASAETSDDFDFTLTSRWDNYTYKGIPIHGVYSREDRGFLVIATPDGDYVRITNIDVSHPVIP